jgi:predicted Zn-dependent protease
MEILDQVRPHRAVTTGVATLASMVMLFIWGTAIAEPASAYAHSGCRAASSTISVYNGAAITEYINATNQAIARWNAVAAKTTFTTTSSSSAATVNVTGLSSAESYWAVTSGTCAGGVFTSQIRLTWNSTTAHSLTATQKRMVGTHEFGHVQGLGHVTRTCSQTKAVMVQGSNKWTCGWGTEPWADDINGVNALY